MAQQMSKEEGITKILNERIRNIIKKNLLIYPLTVVLENFKQMTEFESLKDNLIVIYIAFARIFEEDNQGDFRYDGLINAMYYKDKKLYSKKTNEELSNILQYLIQYGGNFSNLNGNLSTYTNNNNNFNNIENRSK